MVEELDTIFILFCTQVSLVSLITMPIITSLAQ